MSLSLRPLGLPIAWAVLLVACLARAAGAEPQQVVKAAVVSGTPTASGSVQYYLPKQVLLIETAVKTETRRDAVARSAALLSGCDPDAPSYPPTTPPPNAGPPSPLEVASRMKLCIEQVTVETRTSSAQLKVVPDLASGPRLLTAPRTAFADQKISVELQSGALLKSLNANSQGRAGDFLIGIGKFAATIFGVPAIFGRASGDKPPDPTDCNPFLAPFKTLPNTVRLLVSRNPQACTLWKSIASWNDHVESLTEQTRQSEEKLGGTTGPALEQLIAKLKEQRKAADDARKQAGVLQQAFSTALEAFVRANNLGVRLTQASFVDAFELHALPAVESAPESDPEKLAKKLEDDKYNQAAEVLRRTGVVARLAPASAGTAPGAEPAPSPTCPDSDGKDRLPVWFRYAEPMRLQFWAAQTQMEAPGSDRPQLDDKGQPIQKMQPLSDRVELVTHQRQQAQCVVFKSSAFAKREMVVTFDERGQLVKLDQAAESAAAAAAGALASAATAFRDQYADTLTKVVGIKESQRTLKLSDLTTQIETLKKERALLDAQLSAETAASSFDLALRQQQLAAEAATLQAQTTLETAQATDEQRVELEIMKLELERLKQELALVKARAELAAAEK